MKPEEMTPEQAFNYARMWLFVGPHRHGRGTKPGEIITRLMNRNPLFKEAIQKLKSEHTQHRIEVWEVETDR